MRTTKLYTLTKQIQTAEVTRTAFGLEAETTIKLIRNEHLLFKTHRNVMKNLITTLNGEVIAHHPKIHLTGSKLRKIHLEAITNSQAFINTKALFYSK